ncbi:uncharacterized protein LOC125312842 [Rhodamnia argentea]|uniref:Uncharacterized protein LOC125312842 n=1 Tax=Rhodamnia argentea TaxID=178133 RepID=A0ABM3GVQ0_9MYRT|nr:uncharacterized protein LOC125312842 [Rhodamnia argentea]
MAIVNKMRIHSDKTEDVTIVEKILRSLTLKFNFVVCSIQEAKDIEELSIVEPQGSLLVHEQNFLQEELEEKALKATADHFRHQQERILVEVEQGEPMNVTVSIKSLMVIFLVMLKVEDEGVEVSTQLFSNQETEKISSNPWYIDTGCSNHKFGDKKAFSALDESFRTSVKFGDDSTVPVKGKWTLAIVPKGTSVQMIKEVFYVPELKTNLLSVGQLQEKGYEITLKGGVCRIHDEKQHPIAQVNMIANRMFPLHLHDTSYSCFSARLKDKACRDVIFDEEKFWSWSEKNGGDGGEPIPANFEDDNELEKQPSTSEVTIENTKNSTVAAASEE